MKYCDSFIEEACAIYEGLNIVWERGFKQVELERDNAFLGETLLTGGIVSSSLVELSLISCLFKQNWRRRNHVQRSHNMVVV